MEPKYTLRFGEWLDTPIISWEYSTSSTFKTPKYWDLQQKPLDSRPFPPSFQRVNTWQEIAPEMIRSLAQKTPDLDLKYLYLAILRFGDLFWNKGVTLLSRFLNHLVVFFSLNPKKIYPVDNNHELITLLLDNFESTFNRKSSIIPFSQHEIFL